MNRVLLQILSPVSDANIEVDMIVQNVEEDGTTDFHVYCKPC